jgi:hypothetical protein
VGIPEFLYHAYEFAAGSRNRRILSAIFVCLVIASWRTIRARRIRKLVSGLTFQPHGLREPVHRIARGGGRADDPHKISELLNKYNSEIDRILDSYKKRRIALRRQLGDTAADRLDEKLLYDKVDIRHELSILSERNDPRDKATQNLAATIETEMREFNRVVNNVLEKHYPGFLKELIGLLKKVRGAEEPLEP